jgi:hypothetical protein
MSQNKLSSRERRLYQILWAIGFVTWLVSSAVLFAMATTIPWLWFACGGGVIAVIFGMAVRYDNHVWPFRFLVNRK